MGFGSGDGVHSHRGLGASRPQPQLAGATGDVEGPSGGSSGAPWACTGDGVSVSERRRSLVDRGGLGELGGVGGHDFGGRGELDGLAGLGGLGAWGDRCDAERLGGRGDRGDLGARVGDPGGRGGLGGRSEVVSGGIGVEDLAGAGAGRRDGSLGGPGRSGSARSTQGDRQPEETGTGADAFACDRGDESTGFGAARLRTFCDASRQRLLGSAEKLSQGSVPTPCRSLSGEPLLQRRRLSSGPAGCAAAWAAQRGKRARPAAPPASHSPSPPLRRRRPEAPPPSPVPTPPWAAGRACGGTAVGSGSSPAGAELSPTSSLRQLKARLTAERIDFAGCLEKGELQGLLNHFEFLRSQPLETLQAACHARSGCRPPDADACARLLAATSAPRPAAAARPASSGCAGRGGGATPFAGAGGGSGGGGNRAPFPAGTGGGGGSPAGCFAEAATAAAGGAPLQPLAAETEAEIARIVALRRESFASTAAWSAAVLALPATFSSTDVQRGYRTLMKRLHPDKVGQRPAAARAAELVREAREACERSLLRLGVPRSPQGLTWAPLCTEPGRRRIALSWDTPRESASAPVRSFVVAAVDPAYGRPLIIRHLEPDFSQELHRFLTVAELTSFVVDEVDLQKMPSLWQQNQASFKVAAVNEAGQSEWASVAVPLHRLHEPPQPTPSGFSGVSPAPSSEAGGDLWSPASSEEDFEGSSSYGSSPPSGASGGSRQRARRRGSVASSLGGEDGDDWTDQRSTWNFEMELRHRQGPSLRTWLSRQLKSRLANWLRSLRHSSSGTKEELVRRITRLREHGSLDKQDD